MVHDTQQIQPKTMKKARKKILLHFRRDESLYTSSGSITPGTAQEPDVVVNLRRYPQQQQQQQQQLHYHQQQQYQPKTFNGQVSNTIF